MLPLEIFRTRGKGWGVRCARDIAGGSYVCSYEGVLLAHKEAVSAASPPFCFPGLPWRPSLLYPWLCPRHPLPRAKLAAEWSLGTFPYRLLACPLPQAPPVVQESRRNDAYLFDLEHFFLMHRDPSMKGQRRQRLPPLPADVRPGQEDDDDEVLVIDAASTGGLGLGRAGLSGHASGCALACMWPSHVAPLQPLRRVALMAPLPSGCRQLGPLHQPQLRAQPGPQPRAAPRGQRHALLRGHLCWAVSPRPRAKCSCRPGWPAKPANTQTTAASLRAWPHHTPAPLLAAAAGTSRVAPSCATITATKWAAWRARRYLAAAAPRSARGASSEIAA